MRKKICVLQFERAGSFKKNLQKIRHHLGRLKEPDFALVSGEFSIQESKNINPYPSLIELSSECNCNIVAPINATPQRFPNIEKKGYSSMHVFSRQGEVAAIQDKQHFYWKERPWFRPGESVEVFEIESTKIGLVRGLDILYPSYTQQLMHADVLFLSTMATDDMMFELAKVRALENQCYVVMSSFIGKYLNMAFVGNAAIVEPVFNLSPKMRGPNQTRVLQRIREEGVIQREVDINKVRDIKANFPMQDL